MSSVTSVASTSAATGTNATASTVTAPSKTLTTADFLQLLTTEMSNQDPLQPMDDTASMAQLAQFSSLDDMNKLSQSFSLMRADQSKYTAASYLGMQVTVLDANQQSVTGAVTAVDTASDTPQLEINGTYYPLSSVTKIEFPSTTPAA